MCGLIFRKTETKSQGGKSDTSSTSVLPEVQWKYLGVSWEYHGSIMGVRWEYHGSIMGVRWEYRGSTMGVQWECEHSYFRFSPLVFVHHYYDHRQVADE